MPTLNFEPQVIVYRRSTGIREFEKFTRKSMFARFFSIQPFACTRTSLARISGLEQLSEFKQSPEYSVNSRTAPNLKFFWRKVTPFLRSAHIL